MGNYCPCQRLNYLSDPEYAGLACRNPYYAAA